MSDLFKLKNGTVLVSTEAPGGIYNSAQLKKIAELCSKELAIVKATEDQRLALFVKENELERVMDELKATGLGFRHYQAGLHQPVSCLGELCESHEQPALTTAMDLTKLIAELNLNSPLKIGINGCARCCTPCHTLDISVIGEANGYRVSLGGKTSQFPELASFFAESVPAKDLPRLLATVVELFKAKAEPGESFHELLDRVGTGDFVSALAPYSQDAAHRGDDPFAIGEDLASSEESSQEELLSEDSVTQQTEDISPAPTENEVDFPEEELIEFSHDEPEISVSDSEEALISADEAFASPVREEVLEAPYHEEEGLDEVRISSDSIDSLNDDVLLDSHSSPSLHEDAELIFDDEALMSQELLASEPELIEEDSPVLDSSLESLENESSDMPELDADLLESKEIETADFTSEDESMPELDEELLQPSEISTDLSPDTSMLDDGESEASEAMDEQAELAFEERLKASIEEDKKFRAETDDEDTETARADALKLLESAEPEEASEVVLSFDEEPEDAMLPLVDDEMEDIAEAETLPFAAPEAKTSSKKHMPASENDFDGFDLIDQTLRIFFSNGAYLDFQLDLLEIGKSRTLRAGSTHIRVSHEVDGFSIEGGGMRMFYPNDALKAAS